MKGNRTILGSACGIVLGFLAAGAAHSDESGFYAYVDLGRADGERVAGPADRIDDEDTTFSLGVGYNLNRFVAFQFGYHDLGKFDALIGCPPETFCVAGDTTQLLPAVMDRVEVDGFSAQVIGTYPLPRAPVALFAKVGAIDWDSDWRMTPALNESHTKLIYGGGVRWAPAERWNFEVMYEDVNFDVRSVKFGSAFRF